MRGLAVAPLLLFLGISVAAVAISPSGDGGSQEGPSGHSGLVTALAAEHNVRILESSAALLPSSAGPGDSLFLFPTQRPPTPGEAEHVVRFVASGGHLVLAADGDNAMQWTSLLGMAFRGIGGVVASGHEVECVGARLGGNDVCLPSPTIMANVSGAQAVPLKVVSYSSVPMFMDIDSDGILGPSDQGPIHPPMIIDWRHGLGRITVIADGDLWRNAVLADHAGNAKAALALAQGSETVYLDATAWQPSPLAKAQGHWYRILASSDPWHIGQIALFVVLVAAASTTAPQATPMRPHSSGPHADPDVEHRAHEILTTFLDQHES